MEENNIITQKSSCTWCLIAIALFAYPFAKFIIYLAFNIIKQLIPLPNLLYKYCSKTKQSWAVVTGATDGIGLGFCQVLAQLGFNIVLISRNEEKLKETIKNLQKLRPAQYKDSKFKYIVFNFKDSSDNVKFSKVVDQIKDLDIALLVNNVGTSDMKLFHNFSYQQIVDTININCVSMAVVTNQILKIMKDRPQRSALINLSSYMGEGALPFLTLYSATKAFNMKFSEGLSYQYPKIDVMCLKPMFVQSPLSRQKKGFGVPDRRQCAYDSLKQIRWEHESYGYISHRIIGYLSRNFIPKSIHRWGVKIFSKASIKRLFPDAKLD